MASAALSRFLRPAGFDPYEDPQAAPGVSHANDSAKPWTLRRGLQNRLWLYLCGLVFMVFAINSIWEGDPSREVVIARSVAIGVIAVAYVITAWMVDMSIRARWAYVGGFFALLAATATVWGWSFVYYGVYITIVIAALIPWRIARLMIVGWGALLLIIAAVIPAWSPAYIALIAVAMGLAMGSGLESGRVGAQLTRSQRRVSTLAVSAERERISRDLHDILGHSLTAISIKSELAGRLVDANPDAAKVQIAEVEEIARQALADVRSTASAIREVRVAVEVAGARSILLAAGIEAQVPAALPALTDQTSELFGFVVREAVTNVVRHSGATRCTITVTEDRVEIVDNGSGLGSRSGGSGLRGLADRMAAAGGELQVESVPGEGTRVVAVLGRAVADQPPAAHPASAAMTEPVEPIGKAGR